ncbi:MAG TPA: efflux RND transporter periplasmic adaptor subunit [Polyangiales bacterium]|jgi:cobalt-zinc-cadmium efflux system membrane fusion protein|nr:efflux RND transporter periplasmic adaptor subunit [Polyangiales bacterium]
MASEPSATHNVVHGGPPTKIIGLVLAALGGGAVLLAATMWRPDPPVQVQPPAGMKIGEHELTLSQGAPQWNALKVAKVTAARATFGEPVPARVRIDEAHAARIGSPLSGRVAAVFVELGQRVKKGDSLFTVSSPDLTTLQADLMKANVDVEVANASYQRVHDMVTERLMPGKEELAAAAQKREAELSQAAAKSKLQALRIAASNDNEFTVKAPRDGVVVEKNLLPSQEVSQDGTLIQIADVSDVWVVADVFDSDVSTVVPGTAARITTPANPDFKLDAVVDSVSAVVDPERHSVPIKVRLPNLDGRLKPNQFAEMRFRIALPENAVEVAATTLVSDGATQYAYVQTSPGQFVRRNVLAGPVRDGRAVILSGLTIGESVVEQGGILLDNQIELAH